MFSSKSTNSDATPAPIFSRNGERRRLTTQPECFSKTPQKKNPTHANAVTIITSHNVEMQCSSGGGHFAPWWPALRPAAVPEDCQATGIRSNACADWVGWDWCRRDGGMRERTRNAHHGLPSARITKSQRTHLTKPSDITQHHETCLAGRRVRPSIKLLDIGLKGRQAGMDKD